MIQSVCICGAGTMGKGIALNCIIKGIRVVLYDQQETALQNAREYIHRQIEILKSKGKAGNEIAEIRYLNNLNSINTDCVIEAVVENLSVKTDLLQKLESLMPDAILCSNTSSLSINKMAEGLKNPKKFAGLHFFNPVPLMRLVEIVKANNTSENTIDRLKSFTELLGKTSVICKDNPGFIVNRVARPYYLEALYLIENYSVKKEDIDILTESAGFRMGPFTLMDLIGIDINYAVSEQLFSALGNPERLKPSSIQKEMVDQGKTGRKSGEGFYKYEDKKTI